MKMPRSAHFLLFSLTCLLSPRSGRSLHCCKNLHVTADDDLRIWIDGKEQKNLPHSQSWNVAKTVGIDCKTEVIAIKGTDRGNPGGIIASTEDGYVLTNESWKCNNILESGWELSCFDDSTWPVAHLIGTQKMSPLRIVPGIREDAQWIWTPEFNGQDLNVYCRKRLHAKSEE